MSQINKIVKPDKLIADRINKTRRQIQFVELVTTLVVLSACAILFLLIASIFDQWVFANGIPRWLRFLMLLVAGGAATVFFIMRLLPVVQYAVNPAYAAEIIEQHVPQIKNRLINWVFLKREQRQRMPHGIQKGKITATIPLSLAVERHVLEMIGIDTEANLHQMPEQLFVDCSPIIRWGIVLVLVMVLFCVSMILSPKNILQSSVRAAMPFLNVDVPQSIVFKEVKPGNLTVYQGEMVQISARLNRRVAQPVYFVYSTHDGRLVDQRIAMYSDENGYNHTCQFPQNDAGLTESVIYRIVADDSRSEQFKITVKPTITIGVKSVEYRYPKYTALSSRTVDNNGELRAIDGTAVTLTAQSNVPMTRAIVQFDDDIDKVIPLTVIGDSKTTAKASFSLGLDPNNNNQPLYHYYTLKCWDNDTQPNIHSIRYHVETLADVAPTISWYDAPLSENKTLTESHGETTAVKIALNEPFDLAVTADDPDFGLQSVRLRSMVSRTHTTELPNVAATDTLPDVEEFSLDNIELLKVSPRSGVVSLQITLVPKKLELKPGDRVKFWGEAIDTKESGLANSAATSARYFIVSEHDQTKPEDPQISDQPQEVSSDDTQDHGGDDDTNNSQNHGNDDNQGKNDSEGDQGKQGEQHGNNANQQSDAQPADNGKGKSDGNDDSHDQSNTNNQSATRGANQGTANQDSQQSNANGNQQSSSGKQAGNDNSAQQGNQHGFENANDTNVGSLANQSSGEVTGQHHIDTDSTNTGASSQPQKNQTNRDREKNGTSKNNTNQGNRGDKRNTPIDGKSNPGDVFQHVLEQMYNQEGTSGNQQSQQEKQTPGQSSEQSPDNGKGVPTNQNENNTQTDIDPKTGLPRKPNEHDLQKMPEQQGGTQPDTQTSVYTAKSGNDPNARLITPDHPVFQDQNDTGMGSEETTSKGTDFADSEHQGHQAVGNYQHEQVADPNAKITGRQNPQQHGDDTQNGINTQTSHQSSVTPQPKNNSGGSDSSNRDAANGDHDTVDHSPPKNTGDANGPKNDPNNGTNGGNSTDKKSPDDDFPSDMYYGGGGSSKQPDRFPEYAIKSQWQIGSDTANLEYTKQATALAISYLEDELAKEHPNQQLLDRLGWDRHQMQQFVNDWKQMQNQGSEKNIPLLDETLRNIGKLPTKATWGTPNTIDRRAVTVSEAQRFEPPKKYEDRVRAYTESISKQ